MAANKLAVEIIEIDLDRCANTYGVAPCTASIPTTGDVKCFNSKKTCQDVPNFVNDPVTLRFHIKTADFPDEIESVPSLKDVNFDPATLSLGENLGQRATLTAVFNDHPDSDTGPGGDSYLADRDYNPWDQGSYWGKFRARHPFVRSRAMRWITGFVPESFAASYPNGAPLPDDILDDQATRHFVIDSFTGPTPKAEFTIVGKDVLKLADGDRALAPRPNGRYHQFRFVGHAVAGRHRRSRISNRNARRLLRQHRQQGNRQGHQPRGRRAHHCTSPAWHHGVGPYRAGPGASGAGL